MQTETIQKTEKVKIEKAKQFFTIETKEAKSAIKFLKRVTNASPVLPILETVLIEINKGGVKFTSTDLENTLTVIPNIITYSGETLICVNANYLRWFFNKSFEKDITVEFVGDKCKMICGEFHVIVDTEKAENFPKKPILESKRKVIINKKFISEIAAANKFVSHDNLRPATTGIYFHNDEGKVAIASTDDHRLYMYKTDVDIDEVFEAIVPKKCNSLVIDIFKHGCDAEFDVKYVVFKTDDYELISRKIDSRYPNYKAVLPKPTMSIFIDRNKFLKYLGLAMNFSNADTHQIKIDIGKDKLGLITNYDYSEDVINQIACSKTKPTEYVFGVNANFMNEAVLCSGNELIEIKTEELPTKPMIIDEHILLMPLMLNS